MTEQYKKLSDDRIYTVAGKAGEIIDLVDDKGMHLFVTSEELGDEFEDLDLKFVNNPWARNYYR